MCVNSMRRTLRRHTWTLQGGQIAKYNRLELHKTGSSAADRERELPPSHTKTCPARISKGSLEGGPKVISIGFESEPFLSERIHGSSIRRAK